MMLERLLALAGTDVTVVLVSDHGFHSDHLRPRRIPNVPTGAAFWHRPFGVLCMKGPGIRRDQHVHGASVLDITPTVLTLFGLPVGRDMDGRALVQAFDGTPEIESIPSWESVPGECGAHPREMRMDPEAAQALIRQFVALGYLAPPSEEKNAAVALAIQESRIALAQVYLDSRRPQDALPILEGLVAGKPREPRFAIAPAHCQLSLGNRDAARRTLQPFLDDERSRSWGEWMMAVSELQDARPEEALQHLLKAEEANPGLPALHIRAGYMHLRLRRRAEAEAAFREALALDPDNAFPHLGLCLLRLRERRFEEAASSALEAIGLRYYLPSGHYCLGVALARLRQFDRSALAFETALSMQPELVAAHRWLASIYSRPGGDIGRAAAHRARAHVLRSQRRAGSRT